MKKKCDLEEEEKEEDNRNFVLLFTLFHYMFTYKDKNTKQVLCLC